MTHTHGRGLEFLAQAATHASIQQWAAGIETALLSGGALLAVLGAVRWLRAGRPDPLRGAPVRSHRLPLDGVLAPILAFLVAAAAANGVATRLNGSAMGERAVLVANNVGQFCGLMVCVLLAQVCFAGGVRTFVVGRAGWRSILLTALTLWLVSLPLCNGLLIHTERLVLRFWPGVDFREHLVVEALLRGREPTWFVLAMWIGAVVIAPLAEEAFFRGILQSGLTGWLERQRPTISRGVRRWLGVSAAAIAFGMVHAPQWQAVPALALFGLLLGAAYERTGGLLAPIIMHVLFNLKTMILVGLG